MVMNRLEIDLLLNDRVSAGLKKVQSQTTSFAKKIRTDFVDLAAKVYLLQQGFRVLSRIMGTIIDAAARQEDATNRLAAAIKQQGLDVDRLSIKYRALSERLQNETRYGNEAIQELMQQLISVGGVQEAQMERATMAAINFATATGRDLKTAALTVGKAMTGFTGELSRYGIIIDQNVPKTEKAQAALAAMEKQFGGAAQADVRSFSGHVAQLSESWSDFLKELGEFVTTSSVVIEALESIKVAVDFWADAMAGTNSKQVDQNDLMKDLYRNLENVNEQLEVMMERQRQAWFDLDAEGTQQRINDLLEQRARILLTINRLQDDASIIEVKKSKIENTASEKSKDNEKEEQALKEKTFQDSIRISGMLAEKSKEMAILHKTLSIGKAIINTSEGVTKALSFANLPLAAIIAALGAAEVATIAATPLAKGGIVRATPGGTLATIGEGGQDEAVIPLDRGGTFFGDTTINVYIDGGIRNDGRGVADIAEEIGFMTESTLREARGF